MKTPTQNGFTLIEMAAVLMIVGLLLGGLLVPLSAQMDQRKNSETQKALEEIKDALIGYTIANGRLPWPACGTIATGQANAGIELSPTSADLCTTSANDRNVLPWATLGINETDAWGNRYTYRVTDDFADDNGTTNCTTPAPPQAAFALCSAGNLNVMSAASGVVATVAGNVPAVIISHGKNAAGAYTTQGTQLAVGNNPDEKENSDGSTNNKYVSHTPTPTFDDLVVWISPNVLFNRMVTAGKLP